MISMRINSIDRSQTNFKQGQLIFRKSKVPALKITDTYVKPTLLVSLNIGDIKNIIPIENSFTTALQSNMSEINCALRKGLTKKDLKKYKTLIETENCDYLVTNNHEHVLEAKKSVSKFIEL